MKITNFLFLFGLLLITSFVACEKNEDPKTEHEHEQEVNSLPSSEAEVQVAVSEIVFGDFATGVNGGTIKAGTAVGMLDGAHGTFIQLPVGEATVSHTHSHEYHSVVIKGIIENPVEGDTSPKQLPAGSYWYQPAGQAHITKCADNSPEPCVTFFFQTDNFDFLPE